jgi:hypothetical protein
VNRATGVFVALVLAANSGCAFGIAVGRDGVAARWEWFDVRVGTKESRAGEVSVTANKQAMSENALAFGEKVAPIVAEAAARGAAEGLADATGLGAIGAICKIPESLADPSEEEIPPDEVGLTPEEIEFKRERREKRRRSWKEAEARETPEERAERIRRRIEIESQWEKVIEEEEKLRRERESRTP